MTESALTAVAAATIERYDDSPIWILTGLNGRGRYWLREQVGSKPLVVPWRSGYAVHEDDLSALVAKAREARVETTFP